MQHFSLILSPKILWKAVLDKLALDLEVLIIKFFSVTSESNEALPFISQFPLSWYLYEINKNRLYIILLICMFFLYKLHTICVWDIKTYHSDIKNSYKGMAIYFTLSSSICHTSLLSADLLEPLNMCFFSN